MKNDSRGLIISIKIINTVNGLLFCISLFLYVFFRPNNQYTISLNANSYHLFVEKMQEFMSPIYPILYLSFLIVSVILLKRKRFRLSLIMSLVPIFVTLVTFAIEFVCKRVL